MKHRTPLTVAILALTLVVSVIWINGPQSWHDAVHDVAFYTGAQLTTATAWRMLPGAFLVIDYKELIPGLLGLAIVLFGLERRVGWLRTLAVVVTSHLGATILAGVFMRVTDSTDQLSTPDIGSSVVMFSAAAALTFVSRSRVLGVLVAGGLLIDVGVNHDLATSEHFVGVAIGLSLAAALRLRGRHLRHSRPVDTSPVHL